MSSMLTILQGDALDVLKTLPDNSVQCVVTSPPYWGLRDYGVSGQLGLEATPELYVQNMTEVFREVRRVLREDGVLWLNLGDVYYQGAKGNSGNLGDSISSKQETNTGGHSLRRGDGLGPTRKSGLPDCYKAKDIVGIPWMLAFALRADGWWLRSDIVWAKKNPMPESVTDRPTKSHEYIFLLAKAANYFYDAEAIKEETNPDNYRWGNGDRKYETGGSGLSPRTGLQPVQRATRNKRSVWTIPTESYSEAHFATFPQDLIKPCILAGTSAKGCCPKCGAPWERVVVNGAPNGAWRKACVADKHGEYHGQNTKDYQRHMAQPASTVKERILKGMVEKKTVDWKPACQCFAIEDTPEPIPCTVLDPFLGSGTSALVALELGRKSIGIELNPAYIEMAKARCNVTPGLQLA